MKIVSSWRDYYDYNQGVIGQDEKIVYDRKASYIEERKSGFILSKIQSESLYRPTHTLYGFESIYFYQVFVCGIEYHVFTFRGRFFFGLEGAKELDELTKGLPVRDSGRYSRDELSDYIHLFEAEKYYFGRFGSNVKPHLSETDVNDRTDCPVVVYNRLKGYVKNPRLSDFGMGAVLPAQDAFIQIGTFLSREKLVVDNRSDIDRLQSAGFDKKTSFRKM
jgi:hypothetical protein